MAKVIETAPELALALLMALRRLQCATVQKPEGSVSSVVLIGTNGGGASSFWIVPRPSPSEMVALVSPESSTKKVSLGSTTVSPHTATVMVWEVEPAPVAGKVRMPPLRDT